MLVLGPGVSSGCSRGFGLLVYGLRVGVLVAFLAEIGPFGIGGWGDSRGVDEGTFQVALLQEGG